MSHVNDVGFLPVLLIIGLALADGQANYTWGSPLILANQDYDLQFNSGA